MALMRSIGLASSSSCRAAHLQNDVTAARLPLRMAGAGSGISLEERPDRRGGQPGEGA